MKTFPNLATPLVKLDLTFEAGSRYQPQPCVAHAASRLIGEATASHTAEAMAHFLDFRGIVVERSAEVCTACLSLFFLRRYAAELLPLVREMVETPLLTPQIFSAFVSKRRQQLEVNARKTSSVARNTFYETLFGCGHPLGAHARPEDADRLTPELITGYWHDRYRLGQAQLTLSGYVDDELVGLVEKHIPAGENLTMVTAADACPVLEWKPRRNAKTHRPLYVTVPSAVQATVRLGQVLPFSWDDPDPESGLTFFSQFMVLSTLLGGYFGSRLMRNLREERGYTYGIQCQAQIFRGLIVFFITSDVAADAVDDALAQIDREILRLQDEQVEEEELRRVCTYMRGDYLRSIDGIFELAERHRQMSVTGLEERFFDYLLSTLDAITPADLQRIACRFLSPADLLHVVARP